MSNFKEDTDHNSGTTFFFILFSLFVFVSLNNHGNLYSSSTKFTAQTKLAWGDISSHYETLIFNTVRLPDIQKDYECALNKTCLIPFSIQYIISVHNHRIAQDLIQIQKTRLTIEPLLLWRLQNILSESDSGDLPVLS